MQVKLDGSFLSCCARVKCPQRTIFFVPKLGLIPEDDLELTELQEAAKSDPSQQGALLRHVHVGFFSTPILHLLLAY